MTPLCHYCFSCLDHCNCSDKCWKDSNSHCDTCFLTSEPVCDTRQEASEPIPMIELKSERLKRLVNTLLLNMFYINQGTFDEALSLFHDDLEEIHSLADDMGSLIAIPPNDEQPYQRIDPSTLTYICEDELCNSPHCQYHGSIPPSEKEPFSE